MAVWNANDDPSHRVAHAILDFNMNSALVGTRMAAYDDSRGDA
jgi:hypothetical protein